MMFRDRGIMMRCHYILSESWSWMLHNEATTVLCCYYFKFNKL